MNIKKKNGVAIIVVIVLIMLFSAIILSVVLTSTTAYRRASYFRDRNIAFNLAKIGIADALYKLNYRYHDPDHYYGFTSDGECLVTSPANNTTYSYEIKATDLGIPLASINDGVKVELRINDGTQPDTIFSTGKFRGRTAKIAVSIRTLSDAINLNKPLADSTNTDTKGIPEAFNKHVIYASSVTGTGATVKGNIATMSSKPSPWPASWTDATWTETNVSPPLPVVPSLPFEFAPPDPAPAGWIEFQQRGQARYRIDGGSWNRIDIYPGGGVTYASDGTGTETFIFSSSFVPLGNRKIYVRASSAPSGRSGGAYFNGTSIFNSVLADGSITLNGTINLNSSAIFEADANGDGIGTINIYPNTTISGYDLICYDYNGDGTITINKPNITINGAFVTNTSLSITPGATNFTIDAQTSGKSGAIIVYSPRATTVTFNSTPNIILGDNQTYAIFLATFSYPLTVNIGQTGNVDFISNRIQNLNEQAALVGYSIGSNCSINIGSGSNYAKIQGLIYSYGTTGNITLNNANTTITGCLVANGTVNLNNGTISFDGNAFSPDRTKIYAGFVGGRRIFLPTNWKLIW